MTHPIHSADAAEQVQWRNIQKVVRELAAFCFGGPTQDGSIQLSAAYVAIVNSLTAKDGADLKLEPLPRAAAQVGANGAAVGKYDVLPVYKRQARGVQNGDVVLEEFYAADDVRKYLDIAAGAPAETPKPDELTADLINLLNAIRPNFGAVGSRDVDVAAQRRRIDSAIVQLGLIMAHDGREHPTPRPVAATIGAGEGKDAARVPVLYQVRMRPDWDENIPWQDWKDCSEGSYHDHKRLPHYNNWNYEVRALAAIDAAMRSKTSPGEAG